jgi:hypothetical protein
MIYLGFAFAGYKSSWILPTSGPNFIKKNKNKDEPATQILRNISRKIHVFLVKKKKRKQIKAWFKSPYHCTKLVLAPPQYI